MSSLAHLWRNRAKFPVYTRAFYSAWAKRMLTFPELVKRNKARIYLINRGALIDATAEIGKVNAKGNKRNLAVGAYSFIGEVELALHDRIIIGKKVCINDGVKLLSASHDIADPLWRHIKAPIVIKDYAWICTGAIILPGVEIGEGAVVGAGAVVSKNVDCGQVVVGNPAKPINKKRSEQLLYNPCEFLAANRAWLVG
jgi:acetyltransferase-like isoleucine patch superfamily enzyme